MHQRRTGQIDQRLCRADECGEFFGRLNRRAPEVDAAATQGRHEQRSVRPHHALGHAGGAAGAEHIDVLIAAQGVLQLGRSAGEEILIGQARRLERIGSAMQQQTEQGGLLQRLTYRRGKLGFIDQGAEVETGVQKCQLFALVAVIDIDRSGADLAAGQEGLEVFGRVVELDTDVVAALDAALPQGVAQAVGTLIERLETDALAGADEGDAVGNGSGNHLEQVGKIECTWHKFPGFSRNRPVGRFQRLDIALVGVLLHRPISLGSQSIPPQGRLCVTLVNMNSERCRSAKSLNAEGKRSRRSAAAKASIAAASEANHHSAMPSKS